MNYRKWLTITLALIALVCFAVVGINLHIDHYAVRLALFSGDKPLYPASYPDGMNQHLFNTEYVLRDPGQFDSFFFGTSRIWVMDVAKIPQGRFYNMSYSEGLPVQHLAIIKAFLEKGVKIENVVVGLDGFCFDKPPADHETQLMRMMHPDAGGPNRLKLLGLYFFRKPDLVELKGWMERKRNLKPERRFTMDRHGLVLRWRHLDRFIEESGKPYFDYRVKKYEPKTYKQNITELSFAAIEELIDLSRKHHFRLIFYISPSYYLIDLNEMEALFKIKKRLVQLADFYDFSGFNSVTTDPMNYYEEVHFRYRVADMVIKRIFDAGTAEAPDDFGVLVTKENIDKHLDKQQRDLERYLQDHHLK